MRDLFVACGFNSIGIQSSGGAGKVLAEWIRDRRAPSTCRAWTCAACTRSRARAYLPTAPPNRWGLLYQMHWPFRQVATARGARRTAFHDRLALAGAVMGETGRLGRPTGSRPGVEPEYDYAWGRQNWFGNNGRMRAVRDAVALFDRSMAKFAVQGRDACRVLNRLSTADVDVAGGGWSTRSG